MSLNLETAKALVLAEIEKEGENYVYKEAERDEYGSVTCRNYEEDGTPSCLVGRALDSGGIITFDQLNIDAEETNEYMGGELLQAGIGQVVHSLGIAIDDDAFNFLWTLQDAQDDGYTWGDAYKKAVNHPTRIRF